MGVSKLPIEGHHVPSDAALSRAYSCPVLAEIGSKAPPTFCDLDLNKQLDGGWYNENRKFLFCFCFFFNLFCLFLFRTWQNLVLISSIVLSFIFCLFTATDVHSVPRHSFNCLTLIWRSNVVLDETYIVYQLTSRTSLPLGCCMFAALKYCAVGNVSRFPVIHCSMWFLIASECRRPFLGGDSEFSNGPSSRFSKWNPMLAGGLMARPPEDNHIASKKKK